MSPQSRCVTCYVRKFPAFSRERFPLVGTECFENSWQETYNIEGSCKVWSCKVYVGKANWKTSWKLYPCKQEVRSTGSTLADDYSSSFCLFQSMRHCRRRPLVLLVSIPLALLTSSEVPSWAHRAGVSLAMSKNSQLFPVRDSRLFQARSEEHLKHPGSTFVTWYFRKFQLVPVRSPTSQCSNCKKLWKARATSACYGIAGRVESPCWKTQCRWMYK